MLSRQKGKAPSKLFGLAGTCLNTIDCGAAHFLKVESCSDSASLRALAMPF